MKTFYSPTQWKLSLPPGLHEMVCTASSTIEIAIGIDYDRRHLDWEDAISALGQFHRHLLAINPAIEQIITGAYIVLCDQLNPTVQYPIPVSMLYCCGNGALIQDG